MPKFPIVDAHVHLYDVQRFSYGWLAGVPKINRTYLLEDFDKARGAVVVDKIVFAEVAVDPGLYLGEAGFIQELADKDPRLCGIVAHLALEKGIAIESDIVALKKLRNICGIRRLIETERNPAFCLEPHFIAALRLLPKHDLTFDICVKHTAMAYALELVKRCPEVSFVLDHIGKLGRQRRQDLGVGVGKYAANFISRFADTDDGAVEAVERHGQQVAGAIAGFDIDFFVKQRMLVGVCRVDGLSGHRHRAGDTKAGVEAHDLALFGDRRPQLTVVAVEKKHADAIGLQQLFGFASNQGLQRGQVGDGTHAPANVEHDAQLIDMFGRAARHRSKFFAVTRSHPFLPNIVGKNLLLLGPVNLKVINWHRDNGFVSNNSPNC